jgi:hypothetical protein
MRKVLNEALDYQDLVNMIVPIITIDKYEAKMGDDDEIVTVTFTAKGKQVAEDLVDWLERGYDFVLDAQTSEGEITSGKWLVFVEMDRRTRVPERVIEMVEDMVTLTDLPVKEWTIVIDDEEYELDANIMKTKLILSPHEYRQVKEVDLNEMREVAGISTHQVFNNRDNILKDFISKAGL